MKTHQSAGSDSGLLAAFLPHWSVALLLFVLAFDLRAEDSARAIVSGTVVNQATGELLVGAVVEVESAGQRTVSGRGGAYRLALPPGPHQLSVSYTGLDALSVRVEVAAGQTVVQDLTLKSGIYRLGAVTVTGEREGRARALQEQKTSLNPKLIVATDTFGNPDANPGELLQRLPGVMGYFTGSEIREIYIRGMGPSFSSLMIDGQRTATSTGTSANRNYQLEQYGTANLETVELIRAPTPDQDANAIAGFVNMVSRRAYDQKGRNVSFMTGTIWRDRGFPNSPKDFDDKPGLDLLGFAYSDVFSVGGGRNNLGVAFNFNHRKYYTTSDEAGAGFKYGFTDVVHDPVSPNPLTRTFATGDFGAPSTARNSSLSIDSKISDNANVFVKFWGNTNDQAQKYLRAIFGSYDTTSADFAPGSNYQYSKLLPSPGSIAELESSIFDKNSINYGMSAGAELKVFQGAGTLAINGSYSHATIEYPGWIRALSNINGGIGFEIDRRGQDEWYPLFTQTAGPSIYDPSSYQITSVQHRTYEAPNDLYGARLDYTHKFDRSRPVTLKVGLKYDDDSRKQNPNFTGWTWTGPDGISGNADDAATNYATQKRYNQGGGRYGPYPYLTIPNTGAVGDLMLAPSSYRKQTAHDAYSSYANSRASDAKFNEKVTSAYVQGTADLGQFSVLAGVRVERTETEGTGWVRNTTAAWGGNNTFSSTFDPTQVAANLERAKRSFVRRQTLSGSYDDVFPGLHIVYKPTKTLQARASYNRSISRPGVSLLLPIVTENQTANRITVGNPGLKPFHSDNFEVAVEKYFEPVGLISIGAFLKNISDYSRSFTSTVPSSGIDGSGQYAGYLATSHENVGSAKVKGIEVNYQQQLSFLPGALRGLGVFANFTYLQTEGDYGSGTHTKRLPDFAPRTGNAGVSFVHSGLDVRFMTNWVDKTYAYTESPLDVYYQELVRMDLKLQYTFLQRYDIFLDIDNLTDAPSRAYESHNGLLFLKTNEGVAYMAGLRVRF